MIRMIRWYEEDRWAERLKRDNVQDAPAGPYAFSMEELLYQLLLHAVKDPSVDSLVGLDVLWTEYCTAVPQTEVSLKELKETGWISSFCGRWSVVGRLRHSADEAIGTIQHALCWLRDRSNERKGVHINDLRGVLTRLRKIHPEFPDLEWLIRHQIVSEDGTYLQGVASRGDIQYLYGALVRLWYHGELAPSEWAELAASMKANADLIRYFQYDMRENVLTILTTRMLAGDVPTLAQLNSRIDCYLACERNQTGVKRLSCLDEDDIERSVQMEQSGWKYGMSDLLPINYLFFEAATVAEYIHFVPKELRQNALERLADLHHLGMMFIRFISPSAALKLLTYRESRPLALQTLASIHRERALKGDLSAGNAILAWLRYALNKPPRVETDSLHQLLYYLAEYAYRGTRQAQADADLLNAVLSEILRTASSGTNLAKELSVLLSNALARTARPVAWSRRFRLLCDWTERVVGMFPEGIEAVELATVRSSLFIALDSLLETPYEYRAGFVPPQVFALNFWPKLYEAADENKRYLLRSPVRIWYCKRTPDHEQVFRARYQFGLALAWLSALVRTYSEDLELESSLESLLAYALQKERMLLNGPFGSDSPHREALQIAIRAIHTGMRKTSPLLDLDIGTLVTLLTYTENAEFKQLLLDKLRDSVLDENALENLCWADSFDSIFENQLSYLYEYCETYLLREYDKAKHKGQTSYPYAQRILKQLSHLWYARDEKERVLREGDEWWRAVIYLDEGPLCDLSKAGKSWEALATKSNVPAAYINWMLSLMLQWQEEPVEQTRVFLWRQVLTLQQNVEAEFWPNWPEEAKVKYASIMVYGETLHGLTVDAALCEVKNRLLLSDTLTELLRREKWILKAEPEPEPTITPPRDDHAAMQTAVASAMRDFYAMSFDNRARTYMECIRLRSLPRQELALLLHEVIRAVYHLQMFGDKLLVHDRLGEDHCTQLLRVIFNTAAGERWRISASDQQQSGSTGRKNAQGMNNSAENDLVIHEQDIEHMVIEAQIPDEKKWTEVRSHLYKLIGDSRNRPILLLFYGNSVTPREQWKKIQQKLTEEAKAPQETDVCFSQFRPLESAIEVYAEELYSQAEMELVNDCLFTTVSHSGGEDIPLFILYADIARLAHAKISLVARDGHNSFDERSPKEGKHAREMEAF